MWFHFQTRNEELSDVNSRENPMETRPHPLGIEDHIKAFSKSSLQRF
ncbi:hypothetical protein ISN45_At03g053370 [Arabidopsis thaliana x Arabidopsis arenosa]|uniref:Uncharacterized protein n=2 Tax=Arabidopsis TaxID=3701 RepID=A0A8T2FLM8_ARASU|nr:hypothetical protein ISN45_At03g053370 [Arabidopsis thaliana x Arabidopsis arenosa]KAG7635093.1 hypothetical protein ISN44_As03g052190 [Arabidopsis suecica]